MSHPLRPVAWLDAAGSGPGTWRGVALVILVPISVPLECPQLLESDLPHCAKIHKNAIYVPAVPVDADKTHLTGGYFLHVRRAVGGFRVKVKPGTIKEQRYGVSIFDVSRSPVFSRR